MLDLLDNKEKMAKYYLETRHQDSSVIDDDILAYNNLRDILTSNKSDVN